MARFIRSAALFAALSDVSDAKSLSAFGYSWDVRDTAGGKAGPGPNIFDGENVRASPDGSLRFSLSSSAAGWHASETTLQQALGYGDYEFTIGEDVSALAGGDSHVVFGLFLYKDDTHELDVEFARWGNDGASANNADYVNQPGGSGKTLLWKQPPEENTVHRIRYRPGRVDWASYKVGSEAAPYQTFTSTSDVPDSEGMLVHVNLWMFQGKSSWTGGRLDVSLSDFKFTAAPAPASPSYLPAGCQGQAQCYVYESRAAAAKACQDAGYARLCDMAEATGHALCVGGWFSDGEGYWMDQAREGCGHEGFNQLRGSAGAYCCKAGAALVLV